MCNDNFAYGGITFPNFTRYACCNPCCDGSVSAQRVESDNDSGCHCCCPCCCCHCCHRHCHDWCGNDVGGVNDNNTPPCPCRGGW